MCVTLKVCVREVQLRQKCQDIALNAVTTITTTTAPTIFYIVL